MIYFLVFILNGGHYPVETNLSWYECEIRGSIAESFDPELNWYCDHE